MNLSQILPSWWVAQKELVERQRIEIERTERKQRIELECTERETREADRKRVESETRAKRELATFLADWKTQRDKALAEESMSRELLLLKESQTREMIILTQRMLDLGKKETIARTDLLAEYRELVPQWLSEAQELHQQAMAEKVKMELWLQLNADRQERARKEKERQERVRTKERSYIEKAVLPIRNDEIRQSFLHKYAETKQEMLSTLVKYENEKAASRSMVFVSPTKRSSVVQAGRSPARVHAPKSALPPARALGSAQLSPTAREYCAVLRRELRPGLRVFVPKYRLSGQVIEVTTLVANNRSCRVQMDHGDIEWLECDELQHTSVADNRAVLSPSRASTPPRSAPLGAGKRLPNPNVVVPSPQFPSQPQREWDIWLTAKVRENTAKRQ